MPQHLDAAQAHGEKTEVGGDEGEQHDTAHAPGHVFQGSPVLQPLSLTLPELGEQVNILGGADDDQ